MKKIEVGQKVSLKCGPEYPTYYGVITSLFDDHGIPAALVDWDNADWGSKGTGDKIHLTKIKSNRAKYGLKLA